jgi:polysaccharide export outer membrane protein
VRLVLRVFLPIFLLAFAAGCTTSTTSKCACEKSIDAIPVPVASGNVPPTKVAKTPPAGGAFASADTGDYKISPLDVLDITVFQVPDLTKTVEVSSSGQITLPLIGEVKAAGKSAKTLETEIAKELGAKYLQSPQVSVYVKEATSQRVTVEGAVTKPGIYPMVGPTTLLRTIAMAGGLDRVADPRGIVVFRDVDGARQAAKFNLPAIRSGKAKDPVLVGGDVIVVDESGTKTALRTIRESLSMFGMFSPFL